MLTAVGEWQKGLAEAISARFGVALPPEQVPFTFPPKPEMGDASTPVAFSLAKALRRPPAAIAAELAAVSLAGVRESRAAGGYLNLYLDRGRAIGDLLAGRFTPAAVPGKVIVEHTNINPNKAAHVGHLRNAVLGDSLVKCLRYLGRTVEVQNYIDDTGVQVADVVVGFERIKGFSLGEVKALMAALSAFDPPKSGPFSEVRLGAWAARCPALLAEHPAWRGVERELERCCGRFDSFCWELYAQVGPWYARSDEHKAARLETLHLMEEGGNETARMAALVAEEMVRRHLGTMERLGIRYDVLPHESDILKIGFWRSCFDKLKDAGAVHLVPAESEDKNRGCWVMALAESDEFKGMSDADKVIVRSNGTVTYIGKDMAYQLWKFGLLGRDFHYRPFDTPLYEVWRTDAGTAQIPDGVILASEARPESLPKRDAGQAGMTGKSDHEASPSFGGGEAVINVIDVRQSYLQKIVKEGLRQMGHEAQADRSIHFAYEMVALATKFVRAEMEKGVRFDLSEEDLAKPFVEMSGRKGLGFQADLLLDRIKDRALHEIEAREPDLAKAGPAQWESRADMLATAALRYYMVRYNRNQVVAFDLEQALAFEGDTGPYLQYACVRAEAILRKAAEQGVAVPDPDHAATLEALAPAFDDEGWALLSLFMRVPVQVKAAVDGLDLNIVARQFYEAAQAFHAYYHHFPVLQEPEDLKRRARLLTVALFARLLRQGLTDLLGIPVPERM